MTQVPGSVYRAQAQGSLSREEVERLESFSDGLNKRANVLKGIATGAATTLGAAALAAGAQQGLNSAIDALTFKRDLNNVLNAHPQLKSEFPMAEIEMAFRSVRSINPEFAKDPLVGGHLLGQILRNRDPMNPRLAPRFDTQLAIGLAKASPSHTESKQKLLTDAFSRGIGAGLSQSRNS